MINFKIKWELINYKKWNSLMEKLNLSNNWSVYREMLKEKLNHSKIAVKLFIRILSKIKK